jgi:lipopolysaccharide/colanic/teichoic acid biosynthesis glycosyltransferase
MGPSSARAKRSLDLAVSAAGLVLLAPLLPLLALAIRLESRGPVFHRDLRVGVERRRDRTPDGGQRVHDSRGRLFSLLRFRVLGTRERTSGRRPGEHPRLTRVGRVLRRTGLEGWPQLLNVLVGHMSLVGPRAASPQCIDRMARQCPAWRQRGGDVRPGIFGFAQLDHPEGGGFFAAVCEKLLFDVVYERRLRERGALGALQDDLALLVASLERHVSSRGRPVGNDVIRIDHPRELCQVPLDPQLLARRSPLGLSAEVVPGEDALTAFWYLPRRREGPLPEADAEMLGALCDDLHHTEGEPLVVAKALEPSEAPGQDVIHLDLPTSLHEVHSVCEHLQVLWEALAPRSRDEHFTLSMTFLVVEALATAAASLTCRDGRLALSVEVDESELRLRVSARSRAAFRAGLTRELATAAG